MLWWTLRQLKSPDPDVRIKAARSLAAEKNGKAVSPLTDLLHDENFEVRLAAIDALASIGHAASAGPLVLALARRVKNSKSSPAAEYEAISRALTAVGTAAVSPLIQALGSGEKETRRWAAVTLGALANLQAMEPLIATLEDNRSEVRKAAAVALGKLGDARAIGALTKALGNRDFETRVSAAEALGLLRGEQAVDALTRAVEDSNETVQIAAVNALGRIGGLQAAACIRSAMSAARKGVAEAAAAALKSMSFSSDNVEQRAEMAVIRGDFEAAICEGPPAIPALVKALGFKDAQMRVQAAQALGRLKPEAAVPALLVALKDHTAAVQTAAAYALSGIGEPSRVGLEELLSYYDASTVKLAAVSLQTIGSPQSVPALAKLISENVFIPVEYPDLFDAVCAARDSLAGILRSSGAAISLDGLELITGLPDAVSLQGPSPKAVDITGIRDKAADELCRRK